jgi:hypothetical protein
MLPHAATLAGVSRPSCGRGLEGSGGSRSPWRLVGSSNQHRSLACEPPSGAIDCARSRGSPSPPVMKSRQRLMPRSTSCSSFRRRRLDPCPSFRRRANSRLNSAVNSSMSRSFPRRISLSPFNTRCSSSGAPMPRSALQVLFSRRAEHGDRHAASN